ncbi:hypothetical protein MAR_038269 [Mya arenaria]|uniref:Uncharacterized protein n=1 Tax=Mya arenaria TaxID=6604 RepID=A0ABY7F9D1_MYAAR|nr:hypothetical protein MAR_032363 [Mya arenaria]WAR24600.1 hypothetical protein MAR_038269 [Mya arenaria]
MQFNALHVIGGKIRHTIWPLKAVKWRAWNAETLEEAADTVRGGYNIPQLVNNPAKPPPRDSVREYVDNKEVAIEITGPQRQPIPSSDMPEQIDIQELEAKRSWYLFEEIAPLCNNSSACDTPTVPKPSSGATHKQKEKVILMFEYGSATLGKKWRRILTGNNKFISLEFVSPLEPRYAFFSGRTEAFKFKNPLGHPEIIWKVPKTFPSMKD